MTRKNRLSCMLRGSVALGGLAAGLAAATPAVAQLVSTVPGVQTRISADPNGVDLVTGSFNYRRVDLGFGPDAGTRLNVETMIGSGDGDNYSGYVFNTIEGGQNYIYAVRGNRTEKFRDVGSVYTSVSGDGATLSRSGDYYLLTESDGTQASFYHHHFNSVGLYQGSGYIDHMDYIQFTDGERLTWNTRSSASNWCDPIDEGFNQSTLQPARYNAATAAPASADPDPTTKTATDTTKGSTDAGGETNRPPDNVHCYTHTWSRTQSITSNLGYQMRFGYAAETTPEDGSSGPGDFLRLLSATAVNLKTDYCDPATSTCSYSRTWPKLTYTAHVASSQTPYIAYTDPIGRAWSVTSSYNAGVTQIAITKPSSATPYIVATLASNGRVSSVQTPNGTWNYSFIDNGTLRTATVDDPLNRTRTVVSNTTTGLIMSDSNALGQVKSYVYDAYGRVMTATLPEFNAESYSYDARGNITQLVRHAKPSSGQPDISTSATYPASCSSPASCNSPITTTDPLLHVTSYSYDPVHGGVTSVTAPAVNGVPPQTRYSYSALQASYKNASGTVVASGSNVYRLTQVSACQTTASCVGAADEVRTTIGYGATDNLKPVSVTKGSGDGALSATTTLVYDADSNRINVDGPLAGTADTARFSFDAVHQPISTLGPDPDGAGALTPRATHYTYNADGQQTFAELGNTSNQATDLTGFVAVQVVQSYYDAAGRKMRDQLVAGGAVQSVTQYGYDGIGRPICAATRMDPAQWAGQTNACVPQTTGPAGPDRISHIDTYDALDRVTQSTSAYGTAAAATERQSFTVNGQVSGVTDANNNTTNYAYDGYDRLTTTYYPLAASGQNQSNGGDYEYLGYNVNGNVTSRRLRDGNVISFTYDALNRPTFIDTPNLTPDDQDTTLSYDNLGRLTLAGKNASSQTSFTYDALGRKVSEGNFNYTNTSQYDAAGRRTRLSWDDGAFTTYDYLVTGEMTAIHENGGFVLASFAYDNLGRRTTLTYGDGTTTSYGFDAASRLTSLGLDLGGTANDVTSTFTYNPAGQITSRTRSNDAYAWTGAVNVNRSYTANGLNQYTQTGAITPTYDARGNLTSAGPQTYQYTSTNRLAGIAGGGVLFADSLERLNYLSTEGLLIASDGPHIAVERSYIGYVGPVVRRYIHGPGDDEPLVWYEGSGTGDRRYLHADERGSIVAVTDQGGNALRINTYDEYGIPGANNLGRFQYTGQAWLPSLGMYYYKARMYSPTLGRFLQTDPIGYGDGLNWYNYVGGDPVNRTDPTGLVETSGSCAPPDPEHPFDIQVCAPSGGGGGGGGYYSGIITICNGNCSSLGGYGVDRAPRAGPSLGSSAPAISAPQNDRKPICGNPLKEPGAIIYRGTTGSLTFGLGGSFTKGSFTNTRTGTSGTFTSFSFNAGLDVGIARITGQFRDLASFNGGNDNTFSGAGPTPFGVTSVKSYDLDGNLVGNSVAVGVGPTPTIGSSFSVTELANIKQPGC